MRFHSWAKLVRCRNAFSVSGISPVHAIVFSALWKKPLRYLYLALCSVTAPCCSSPLAQSIWGLNSRRKGLLFVFPAEALQLWTRTASAALRTDCSASFLICSLVRLIFAAEERLFPLVLIAPLQVCAHLFSYQI